MNIRDYLFIKKAKSLVMVKLSISLIMSGVWIIVVSASNPSTSRILILFEDFAFLIKR